LTGGRNDSTVAAESPAAVDDGTGGAGARVSEFPLRLPNKNLYSQKVSACSPHQLGEQRREQSGTGALYLRAADKRLRHLAEQFCSFMVG
jgi:hypothetical protein